MKTLASPENRVEITERLKTVTPQSRALWGRMTAHQMLCHCTESFLVIFGEKEVSPATGLFERTVMKYGALWFPMPWPKDIPTRPELDQVAMGACPTDFTRDRRELIMQLDRFCRPGCDFSRAFHPIFGRMSEKEWKRWGYLHLDHHLRQFGA